MKIYTKHGDDGSTMLTQGNRVAKDHIQVCAIGTLDELNAYLGLLVTLLVDADMKEYLMQLQGMLFEIGAFHELPSDLLPAMEHKIDEMQALTPTINDFVLPGGCIQAAEAHVCRTVCRRAERCFITLSREKAIPATYLQFLNRLSDFLFVLARYLNFIYHIKEKKW